jgi:amino acid adenylation domain-containing protein
VRWRADGTLEYLGRLDGQVKIRGFRIEPGEIEAVLRGHGGADCVVVAREDVPGEKRLVAYVAGRRGRGGAARAPASKPAGVHGAGRLRGAGALPLTPNGKLDRKALPAPEHAAEADRYVAPRTPVEEVLAGIWAEVLRIERVGRRDNFFELGGHSLLAVQVISRVRQVLAVEAELGQVFTRPVLQDFARGLETAARAELPPIEPALPGDRLPLSFAQQRLWFLEQMGNLGSAYHISRRLRLRGALDRAALARALDGIVARHEALRTTFTEGDGVPEQRIAPAEVGFHLVEHDLAGRPDAELERVMTEEARAPFDLRRGPLVRGRLVRLADGDHVLLLTMHHIVTDGWSMGVLYDELSALYAAHCEGRDARLAALPVQYADYAAWQRRWMGGDVLREQEEYWTRTLAGAPRLLELPTDRPRPAEMDHAGAGFPLELDAELTAGLNALSRRHGATLHMTLLAGWAAVLGRLSGQDDVVIGTPTAGRGRREIEGLIGFFINTLAVRVDLSGTPTVAQLLERVKERTLEAQHNQDIPFEQVVERVDPVRTPAHTPLFQVWFVLQNAAKGEGLSLPGLELGEVGGGSTQAQAKLDLLLSLGEVGDRIAGSVTYATALFERETVERWVGYLRRVLEEMVADDSRRVERLEVLGEAERALVLEAWNGTAAEVPADRCLHELVEAQVRRTPDATALVFEGEPLTYAELNRRANRLAHHLRSLGVGPDARVGLCLERSLEMMVGLLAVLKAGGAYVPLDPGYPAERLAYMLADSDPAVVLSQRGLRDRIGSTGAPVLELDEAAPAWGHRPVTNPERGTLTPEHLAYVIYTSGSTGRPKGVGVPHRAVVNALSWMQDLSGLSADDAVLHKTPYSFDASLRELLPPLLVGGRLVLARPEGHRDPGYLLELMRREGITTLHAVPSLLQALVDEGGLAACDALRTVMCGGEALAAELVRRFSGQAPWARLYNVYGPTEAAVDVTAWPCTGRPDAAAITPIGSPMANVRIYLLDPAGEPVPVGVAGELHIGGVQVARGYLGRAALTAERFVADPFTAEPGARLYRTGDRARWRADGAIEYLGRLDHQVKVRGFRIELGEIEGALRRSGGVADCVVVAREDEPGEKRLVAYVVGHAEAGVLSEHLLRELPEYMVPSAFVFLDALPLTPNGKLDRKALPAPEGDAYARRSYEAPQGEVEAALAEIWSELLGVERVGRRDHFFELGGHSLLAIKLIRRMRRAGLNTDVRVPFTTPVLAELALAVGGASPEVEVPANGIPEGCGSITPEMLPLVELSQSEIDRIVAGVPGGAANVQDIYPLAPLQEGILFHHLLSQEGDPYQSTAMTEFDTRARLEQYLAALQAVIDRHDILRTALAWEGLREPVQVVWRHAPLPVEEVRLDAEAEAEDAAGQLWRRYDPRQYRMDLGRAPLRRACIAEDRARGRWLLLILKHHLAGDHESLEVQREEISAHLRGLESELPVPLPFRGYVAQARLGVSREEHERFFRGLLGDVEEPTAPYGLLDVWGEGHGIGEARLPVAGDLGARLRRRARALGVSAASLCHLAWAQVLARLSGRQDVVFGTLLFGRMQGGEGADRVMGPFINTLPVRIGVGEEGVEAAVRRTHALLADLLRHEHASLALAQRCSGVAAPAPLFTSLLNYRYVGGSGRSSGVGQPGEGVREILGPERTNYPVALSVDDRGEEFSLVAQVTAPAEAERVCRMMHTALERLVEALELSPGRATQSIDVLPEAERRQVVEEWNRTGAEYPAGACIHELFEVQTERTPDAVAVRFEEESLTYRELNARANRLAHHLRGLHVGPDARVGVCVERGPEMIAGLLAILKAGGAYVPLDPAYPADRLRTMLEDSAPAALVTQSSLAGTFAGLDVPVVELDAPAPAWAEGPETNPGCAGLTPGHLAYVIYTSGSTGRPKGVMNQHRGVVNRLAWMQAQFRLGADDVVLQKTPFGFDVSVWEFFWPLQQGACLVMARPDGHRDPLYLQEVIELRGVTTLHFVPSMLQQFVETADPARCGSLLRVVCSGEALPPALVERFCDRFAGPVVLTNLYGPTEAAVDVSCWTCPRDAAAGVVPIGRPVWNTALYVLDAALRPVPVGVPGELYIGGVQVARGYQGRAAMTAERFVPDSFSTEGGARLYRTGDRARWRADGAIEYLGRLDFQVKVRGFRIEMGEIEAALRQVAGVRDCTVIVRDDETGDPRLVAYVVGDAEAEALRDRLRRTLPEYMVPSAFVFLDALPLTANGKLDRKALPAPEGDAYARRSYEAPLGEVEAALAEIWSELLGVERVGRWDHFFELGGHSLLAIKLIERMRRVGLYMDVRALFTTPLLAELALAVGGASLEVEVPANGIPEGCEFLTPEMLPLVELSQAEIDRIVAGVPGGAANVQDIYPLAPLQEGILFHHLLSREGDPYLMSSVTEFDTRARLEQYLAALQAVIDRHDVLRTAVAWEGLRAPVQVVWRHAPLPVEEVELDAEAEAEDAAGQLWRRHDPRQYRMELGRAPLRRACIAEDRARGRWLLLMLMHHLTSDHESLEVQREEISAHLRGLESELPAPLPFRNYVAQVRLGVSRDEHERFFRGMLGDVEEPTAPYGLLDVWGEGQGIGEARLPVESELGARLRRRARALGVSAASLFHLAWAQVLARVSGRSDVVFGTLLFGRMQGGESTDRVMGPFINTLPVRIGVGEEGAEAAVRRTHALLAELLRHEHASLVLAQRCSGVAASAPLFTSLLNYRYGGGRGRSQEAGQPGEGVRGIRAEERTNYPVTLAVDDRGEEFSLTAKVAAPAEAERVCRMMHTALERLVKALEVSPGRATQSIDVLPEAERRQVVEEWNRTDAEYPAGSCIHELFEVQAARTPGAVAVRFEEESLTYAELNARANRLAHHLRGLGMGPDVRVAICLERGVEMVTALLAALKAGGAYVPLDPSYPVERLREMLADSRPAVLLTQASLRERVGGLGVAVLALDADAGAWAHQPKTNPRSTGLTPEHLAYVIYTSGSTGRPKGVMVRHGSVANLAAALQARIFADHPAPLRVGVNAPLVFDGSVKQVVQLLAGHALCIVPEAVRRDPAALVAWLRRERVDALDMTPSLLRLALAEGLGRDGGFPRLVLVGGEAVDEELRERMSRVPTRFYNVYGPTECTVDTTVREIEATGPAAAIGGPLPNVATYVLDPGLLPVPVGVAGELYVGGAGLARGYLDRPATTADRFVPDPFGGEAGARLYRTGDRVRWREGAEVRESGSALGPHESPRTAALPHCRTSFLEYLGRLDVQVKVRGFRIELGEIEARLARHAQVREAVVAAREDVHGDPRLVAYYVVAGEVDAGALRAHLTETLPEYMVPSAFVRLESLPLTPNGKVDRKALPVPAEDAYARRGYEAPLGEVEAALAEIWAEVVGVERVGRWDHFFELGGHSLLAIRLIERMRRMGLYTDVRALFTTPVLAELALAVGRASSEVEVPANGIPKGCEFLTPEMLPLVELTQVEIDRIVAEVPGGAANVQDIYPLAPLQEGILFHHLLSQEGDPYLLPSVTEFDTRARLEQHLAALQAVIDRHDVLRTAMAWEGLREPVQVVWRHAPLPVEEVELDAEAEDAAGQLWRRYDPRQYRMDLGRAPLRRACIAEDRARGRWLLLMLRHHLTSDHESLEVQREEISAHLRGRESELPAPLPFRNYVARARLGVSREEHERFFRGLLGDVEEPTAPYGLLDVWGEGHGIGEARLPVAGDLGARLRRRARALGVSAASLCHLAWAQVLVRLSGRQDVVFGTLLFGRMQGGEGAERVMGPFINTLPVRIGVGEEGVEAAVRRTHALLADLLRHEHASLALAQRCSGVAAPAPLFTSLLNYRYVGGSGRSSGAGQPGEGVRGIRAQERTNYPVTLAVDDRGEEFSLTAKVAAPAEAERVCRMMHTALERLVEALELSPGRATQSIDVLPEAERRQVVEEWNRTDAEYPAGACIHELFEVQVERTPDAVAVAFDGGTWTYAELNARANRLAHHLKDLGVGPDVRVGICMERSLEMAVALLAILKAGGAYVPLDPAYPEDRLHQMLQESRPLLLLTHAAAGTLFADAAVPVVDVEADAPEWAGRPATNPDRGDLTPDHLCYVIYTSGSTGRPKGVMNPHRCVVNRLVWGQEAWGMGAGVLCKTSLNFDGSLRELFWPWSVGARVVLARPEGHRDPDYLLETLHGEGIPTVNLVPSMLQVLLEHPKVELMAGLERVLCGGEALPGALLQRFHERLPRVALHNLYGPSEAATALAALHCAPEQARATVPIGRPTGNVRVHVLDAAGRPVPVGVPGELFIGGVGVARGYLDRPELTAERFVPDPFGGTPGARLYRTGDLARWLADGRMEFLGRNDFQVKIRGFRIEPGEVEAALASHAAVREALVVAREDRPGDRRLVAYVVGDVEAGVLREHLRRELPEYMVPAAFVPLERLPLAPNGKLDRKALPAPEYAADTERYEAPRTPVEEVLAGIWVEVLRIERVGVHDSFFELGGHSLLATRVVSRVRAVFAIELPLRALFERPTVAELAGRVEEMRRAELPVLPPVVPVERAGALPLSFAQERLWFLDRLEPGSAVYNIPVARRLGGALDEAALERALGEIVRRHEALRTVFTEVDGSPVQVIAPFDGFALPVEDLSGLSEADREAALGRRAGEEARRAFDLSAGSLFRAALLRLGADDHVLLLSMHHIVSDGWSMGVLFRELSALYAAYREGGESPLAELAVQYADYAVWQREQLAGEMLDRQLSYWRARLAGAPELLELPTDHSRPPVQTFRGATVPVELSLELLERLQRLGRSEGRRCTWCCWAPSRCC